MPIYEYQCQKCGEVFEVFQKVNDPPPKRHSCGSTRVRRIMSQTSFILKGTGWYVTDYARKEKKDKEASKAENSSGSADGKSSGSADSKSSGSADGKSDKAKSGAKGDSQAA